MKASKRYPGSLDLPTKKRHGSPRGKIFKKELRDVLCIELSILSSDPKMDTIGAPI